jgi:hypothetical protein
MMVLLGFSNCLGLIHERVIDTSVLYAHPKGLPFRYGLKYLVKEYLGRFIQDGGHDSVVDSVACIELIEAYLRKNKGFK